MSEEKPDKGKSLVERARMNRRSLRGAEIKTNKRCRHVWSLDDYVQVLTHTHGFSQAYAYRLLRVIFSVMQKVLLRGDVAVIPGVGRLYVLYMAPREGQESQVIPDAARLVFRTSTTIQRMIRPRVKYFIHFNDNPVAIPSEDDPKGELEKQGDPGLDVEKFVVEQGWEDESGKSLEGG